MNDLTHKEVIRFFEGLDLTERVEILTELTGILHKDIHKDPTSPARVSDEDAVIDTLFGAWADESDLNEEAIFDRTFSERDINLN